MWHAVGFLSFPILMVSRVLELRFGPDTWGQRALDDF